MIRAFLGSDDFSRLHALESAVAQALGDRKEDPLARQILYADDSSIDDVVAKLTEACTSVSMFGPDQAVILRHADKLRAADMEFLSGWLKSGIDPLLFIEAPKLDGRSEFSKVLRKVAKFEEYESPRQWEVAGWISTHCRNILQVSIDTDAGNYVAECLGSEPGVIHAELDKIKMLSPGVDRFSMAIVRQFIVPQRELGAFEINNSFGNRSIQEFVRILRRQMLHEGDAISINSSLFHHAVQLLHTQCQLELGTRPDDIAKICNANPFIFKKNNMPQQATKWPRPLLLKVIQRLSEMDYELKMGYYDAPGSYELAACALIVR